MAGIGAGVGLLKSEFVDRPRADRERRREGQIAQWSPWTGMQPNRVSEADPMGLMMQGGMTGAMLGQGMARTDKMNEMMDVQKELLKAQTAQTAAGNVAAPMPMSPMMMSPQGYGMSPNQAQSPWWTMGK